MRAALELLGPEPAQAVEQLEALRTRRPDNGTVLINLGIGYRRSGRLAESSEVLREAVRLQPARGLAHLHLAVTYSQMTRERPDLLGRALEHAERTIELQPASGRGYGLRGDLLAMSGQSASAVEAYRAAARREPGEVLWLHRLGTLLCQLGRFQEAIPVLEEWVPRQPEDSEVLFLLGAAQANSGRFAEARTTLEKARQLSPRDPKIRQALEQLERAHQIRR